MVHLFHVAANLEKKLAFQFRLINDNFLVDFGVADVKL